MSGLGLSSDEEDFNAEPTQPESHETTTAPPLTEEEPSRNEEASNHEPADSQTVSNAQSLGLSSDEEDVAKAESVSQSQTTTHKSAVSLGLSSEDEDDEAPTNRPATSTLEDDVDPLGLDSDDDGIPAPSSSEPQSTVPAAEKYEFRIPTLPAPRPGTTAYLARMPEQLGILTQEFNPGTFLQTEAPNFVNSLLWRHRRDPSGEVMLDEQGKPIRESNARLVKWSDGTMQLQVGSDLYDMNVRDAKNSFIYVRQTSLAEDGASSSTVLECQQEVVGRVNLRHSTIDEATKRKMKARSHKSQNTTIKRTQMYTAKAPEKGTKRRKTSQRTTTTTRRPRPSMGAKYLEDRESVSALKSRYRGAMTFDDDSDDLDGEDAYEEEGDEGFDEDGGFVTRAPAGSSKASAATQEAIDSESDDDDDDEEDFQVPSRRNKPAAGGVLEDDSD